jgi:hypothetical protein
MSNVQCRACLSPSVAQIDAATRAGRSDPSIGREFGLSKDSIRRHRLHGHVSTVSEATEASQNGPELPRTNASSEPARTDALQEMLALVANLKATPADGLSPVAAMALAREKRLAVVELGKLAGPPPPAHPTLDQVPDWLLIRALLARHPELREAIAETGVREAIRATDPAAFFADAFRVEPMAHQITVLRSQGNLITLKGRQTGLSTVAMALACWQAVHLPGSLAVIVSPSLKQSQEVAIKARAALRNISLTPLEQDSATVLALTNGSRIMSLPGTSSSVRGFTAQLVIIDESAYVEEDTFTAARALVATGGRLLVQSTPAGAAGWFFELWQDAQDDPDWTTLLVKSEEASTIPKDFLARELASMGPVRFAAEYGASFEESGVGWFDIERLQSLTAPAEGSTLERITSMGRERERS